MAGDPGRKDHDEREVRTMVALIEAQAGQIASLKAAVGTLEGRLALRGELDAVVAAEVRSPLDALARLVEALRGLDPADASAAPQLVEEAAFHVGRLDAAVREAIAPQGTGGPAVVGRARLREALVGDLVGRAVASVPAVAPALQVFGAELAITTSPPRLVAVLVELFDNAVRHGGPGPVECRAALLPEGRLALWVADQGPGLRGADPEVLLEPFVRGTAPARPPHGRGIGLYLARMLARSLGGEASLAERPGGGVVVALDLPQRRNREGWLSLRPAGEDGE